MNAQPAEKSSKSKRGMMSLWITLIIMGSITAIAFVAIDRAISSGNIDRSFINPWVAQHKIVYECVDSFSSSQLCLIYSDGSGQRQLTFDGNVPVQYSNPQINSVGQIVAECHDQREDVYDICLLHTEKPGEVLRIGLEDHENHNPVINDKGLILFDCEMSGDRSKICYANEFGTIIHGTYLDESNITYGSAPRLNNSNALVILCGERESQEICHGLFGAIATTPISLGDELEVASPPLIDSLGNIYLTCVDTLRQIQGVCRGEFLSPTDVQFVLGVGPETELTLFDINDGSPLLMTCHDVASGRIDICLANVNSDVILNATEHLDNELYLDLTRNDAGNIVFTCGWNLCVMNSPVGPEVLTDLTEERRASNPDIQ